MKMRSIDYFLALKRVWKFLFLVLDPYKEVEGKLKFKISLVSLESIIWKTVFNQIQFTQDIYHAAVTFFDVVFHRYLHKQNIHRSFWRGTDWTCSNFSYEFNFFCFSKMQ